jgi:hypothetical protein
VSLHGFRSFLASLLGLAYQELPAGIVREDIDAVLDEFNAQPCGESGTPAYEVNNEYFRIGRRKVRLCTEDEMFVSVWGPKDLVREFYAKIIAKMQSRQG